MGHPEMEEGGAYVYVKMMVGLCPVAVRCLFLMNEDSAPQGRFFERWWKNIFQILITLKEEKIKAETSKVQHVTEITIHSMISNIQITLKFRVALL